MTAPPEPDDYLPAAARIAANWGHGHDTLTDGCALCNAEYDEVRAWLDANPITP